MRLIPVLLAGESTRSPCFDGWDVSQACFDFPCVKCDERVSVPFEPVRRSAWDWRDRFAPAAVAAIETHFRLDETNPALADAWTSISGHACPHCAASYLFHAELTEHRPSTFRVVARGVALRQD